MNAAADRAFATQPTNGPQHKGSAASTTLQSRLTALASDAGSEGTGGPVDGSALERILQEVDTIMLPRDVIVLVETRPVARLVISQRRLVGLELAESWRGDLLDGARRLLHICGDAAVRFQRYATQAPIGAESLSADTIRCHLSPPRAASTTRMDDLRLTLAPYVVACLYAGEDGSENFEGRESAGQMLRDLAAHLPHDAAIGARSQALILSAPNMYHDHKVLVARADRSCCLALFHAPALADVVTAWQMVFDRRPA